MVVLEEKIDFAVFKNVKITGTNINTLTNEEVEVLYTQSRYCQAMVDADLDTMKEIVSNDEMAKMKAFDRNKRFANY